MLKALMNIEKNLQSERTVKRPRICMISFIANIKGREIYMCVKVYIVDK